MHGLYIYAWAVHICMSCTCMHGLYMYTVQSSARFSYLPVFRLKYYIYTVYSWVYRIMCTLYTTNILLRCGLYDLIFSRIVPRAVKHGIISRVTRMRITSSLTFGQKIWCQLKLIVRYSKVFDCLMHKMTQGVQNNRID